MKKLFHWLPRTLAIINIIFISLFALDVFDEPRWFLALVMHLIPTFILAVSTIIAFKNEKTGGLIYVCLGVAFLVLSQARSMIVALLLIIIGLLFMMEGYFFAKKKSL
ncbi:MAG: DUF7670 domain-containing protein [Patescibacteria group bacterium]